MATLARRGYLDERLYAGKDDQPSARYEYRRPK